MQITPVAIVSIFDNDTFFKSLTEFGSDCHCLIVIVYNTNPWIWMHGN